MKTVYIISITVLETPHVIVGAAIATKVVNPLLSLPLVLGSHFILDRTPHWNPHLNTELKKHGKVTIKSTKIVIVDVALALASGTFIAYQTLPDINRFMFIMLAAFLSILPDIVEGPYFFLKMKSKSVERWIKFQKSIQVDAPFIPGVMTQILTVAACFYWIFLS